MKTKSIVIIILSLLLIITVFSPLVNCDVLTPVINIQTNPYDPILGVNTNCGTVTNINGYDVFSTDRHVFFYSGNSSGLIYMFNSTDFTGASQTFYNYRLRIINYNSTAILAVMSAESKTSSYCGLALSVTLINTDTWETDLWITTNSIVQKSASGSSSIINDLVVFTTNQHFYALLSGLWYVDGIGADWCINFLVELEETGYTLISDSSTSFTDMTLVNYMTKNVTSMTSGSCFWIESETEYNTVYIIGASQGEYRSYRVLKINPVTPSITFMGDYECGFPHEWCEIDNYVKYNRAVGNVWFVDYEYYNGMYNVLFAHTNSQADNPSDQINIELLRFNDTNNIIYNWQTTFLDSDAFGNIVRIIDIIPPSLIWGNPSNPTLFDNTASTLTFGLLYAGQLANIYQIDFTITDITTESPDFDFPSSTTKFRDGAATINIFNDANEVGAYLSPYGYGNMFMIDYQHSKVCANYQIATNPATGLYFTWDVEPIYEQKSVIQPQTTGGTILSQNYTYHVTAYLMIQGIIQTDGTYSVYSNGESQATTWDRAFTIPIKSISGINSGGQITFDLSLNSYMSTQAWYEAHQINVTISDVVYTFGLGTTWIFEDINGNTLPGTYEGKTGGGNAGSTNDINSGTNIYIPVQYWIVIIIYMITTMTLGLLAGRDGLVVGLMISTVICALAQLIPTWCILLIIIGIVYLILDKTDVIRGI